MDKEEMKNCVCLKPELVAQIEFTEWTPDGHLRHSKFVGLREDKDPREVADKEGDDPQRISEHFSIHRSPRETCLPVGVRASVFR